jgi:hypothetical protein
MKKVISYEYRSNNSSQFTVAHLECGHERTFEYGTYPKMAMARCWVCDAEVKTVQDTMAEALTPLLEIFGL